MSPSVVDESTGSTRQLRVAIEGCGHGTLDAIYASIHKACEVKGWDNVDLVIICGDFQAVRDRRDLNVTAMPAKYREMADFHQYYWGKKKAPFLTIFIGGNHEASNHLWELYYGGWVAPNIYYLGAANVIHYGSLKIAGISGIWKGYDYKKPHYERLPYSQDDMYSIYHVRELDSRKLLAYRSQVDIGLSHDWPRGIEWLGNHQELFKHKRFLKDDADEGKLGNVAAKQILDHLRPPYWFSAHLHVRYAAVKQHESETAIAHNEGTISYPEPSLVADTTNGGRLAAWNNFHAIAKEDEAKENAQLLQEQVSRREAAERAGEPVAAEVKYNETYKRVKLADGFSRTVTSVMNNNSDDAAANANDAATTARDKIPQLDGCIVSRPSKRYRSPEDEQISTARNAASTYQSINTDGAGVTPGNIAAVNNPDAIDLDESDDEEELSTSADNTLRNETEESPLLPKKMSFEENRLTDAKYPANDTDQIVPPQHVTDTPNAYAAPQDSIGHETSTTNSTNGSTNYRQAYNMHGEHPTDKSAHSDNILDTRISGQEPAASTTLVEDKSEEVSEEMRAQLAALSTKFADAPRVDVSASLPHPEAIQNTITKFLALSKCAAGQRFLQLMEIAPCNQLGENSPKTPRLRYDPEWLAILRVFAPELSLGGTAKDAIPQHRGDTYYRDRILAEEEWVQEHVVDANLLDVPDNFTVFLPETDVSDQSSRSEMPEEGTNPQTAAFCQLIGIENKFHMSEEGREARRKAGPSESSDSHRGKGGPSGHRGGRGGQNNHRGRGGRGRGRRF